MYGLNNKRVPSFFAPQFRPNLLDRDAADLLLPLNDLKIDNNYGNRAASASLIGLDCITPATSSTSNTFMQLGDGGLKAFAGRPTGANSSTAVDSIYCYLTAGYSAGERIGAIQTDGIALFKGQTSTTTIKLGTSAAAGAGDSEIYGVISGSFPTTVGELDALTLTTTHVTYTAVPGSATITLDISAIVDELTATSGWEFGQSIILVAVNDTPVSDTSYTTHTQESYYYSAPDLPKAYTPVTPAGRMYNFGGYTPSSVNVCVGSDVTDGSLIYTNSGAGPGTEIANIIPNDDNYYIQYLSTSTSTDWRFNNIINPQYIPDYIEVGIEIDLLYSNTYINFTSCQIKDDFGTIIAAVSSKQAVACKKTRSIHTFRVPVNKAAIDPSRLSYLKCVLTNFYSGSGDYPKIYSITMRPVFGQNCKLSVSHSRTIGSGDNYAVSFLYYDPCLGGTNRALLETASIDAWIAADSVLISSYPVTLNTGLQHIVLQRKGSNIEYYVDGVLKTTQTITGFAFSSFTIGPMNGAYSDLRMYSKALSTSEIQSIATDMFQRRHPAYPDPSTITSPVDSVGCDPLILFLGLF